jgi:hypothetical protein
LILAGTYLTVNLAKGYRLDPETKTVKQTGILNTTSYPAGANVFVDDKLLTATNNTLTLEPKEYNIKISKEGFFDWEKRLTIEKELVTQAEAFLFPKVPDLKPATFDEVLSPQISPDRSKILFQVPLPNPNAGLWVLDINNNILGFEKDSRQISKSTLNWDYSKANITWSPDNRQILVDFSPFSKYLLSTEQLNVSASLKNIAPTTSKILSQWEKEENTKKEIRNKKIPLEMQKILATASAQIKFNSEETKIMYLATASAEISENLIPAINSRSTQKENRKLEPNKLYVYDLKEDKNFEIALFLADTPTPLTTKTKTETAKQQSSAQLLTLPDWFNSGRHLLWTKEGKVVVCEYDNTNFLTVYSGPIVKPYLFVPSGANKFYILTTLSSALNEKPNLFSINLR